jgi:hypothetical protein
VLFRSGGFTDQFPRSEEPGLQWLRTTRTLEEGNIIRQEYQSEKTQYKVFSPEIKTENFPLRGKQVLLHIKFRRWTLLTTGKIVKRD